jgi:hypothetical protein
MRTDPTDAADDGLAALASGGHTPDSMARALLAGVVEEMVGQDGLLEDALVELTVRVREVPSTSDSESHGLVELCLSTGGGHGVCVFWPPPLPIVIL